MFDNRAYARGKLSSVRNEGKWLCKLKEERGENIPALLFLGTREEKDEGFDYWLFR